MPDIGFWNWARQTPDRLALVTPDGEEFTFGELGERVNRLSNALRGLGLKKGDGVATFMGNRAAAIELFMATSQTGLYLTPINYHLTAPEAAYILSDCEAKVFVTEKAHADTAREAVEISKFDRRRAFSADAAEGFGDYQALIATASADVPADRIAGQSMLYTSGTTGRPKGVRRPLMPIPPESVAQLYGILFNKLFNFPVGEGVHLVTGPLYHAAPGGFGTTAMHLGQTLVLMDKWAAEETLRLIERYGVTTSHMVPTMFHRIWRLPESTRKKYDISSLACVLHGAAPCPVDLKKNILEWWGPVVYEYYGATEGGGTAATPEQWLKKPGTVGTAWPGSTVKILDDEGNEVPAGTPGTVYMGSPIGNFEYYKDQEKTHRSRKSGMFTVGDIGYLDEDGFLFLCDRKADMIISGGVNIYSAEVEKVLIQHPKVGDVAVFGIPHDDWGEEVKAVVEPAAGVEPGSELAEEIMEFARKNLAKFKLPRSIDFVDELPRQPSGKLYKRLLRDPYWEGTKRRI